MAFNRARVEALEFPPVVHTVSTEECLLYALSLGLGRDPTDPHDLSYVYEADLRVLPTMAAVLCTPGHWVADPALGINADSVLHGEQAVRFHRPIPVGRTLTGCSRVTNVWDKGPGKGALVEIECRVTDEADSPIWTVNRTAYLRGEGGYGGPVQPRGEPWAMPKRSPDAVYDMPTGGHQALLYRLNGDMNPVHADPAVAAGVGFPRPILHGLCTYGIAGYALLHSVCDHDQTRMGALSLRFSAPAYPGDTIRTEIWRDGDRALFRCLAVERGVQVTTNGVMDPAMGDFS
jgi:acyl dehydratase